MNKVIALLPAYNEELSIGSMVIGSKKYVDKVLVIDDGSSDNTAEIARIAGAEVISHKKNKGKGEALKTGFKAANNYDVIITIDSDGQHNFDEIPKIIEPIINGEADLVVGSRYINGNGKNTPTYRRIGQIVLDKATNINNNIEITDSQSGYRAFAGHIVPLFRFNSDGFGIESEMLSDAASAGVRIKEVEIGVRYDLDGSTQNPISHGVGVLIRIFNELEFKRPLFYFSVPGAIICLIGLVLGLMFFGDYIAKSTIYASFVPSAATSLAPTMIAVILFMFGGFLTMVGIILHSISRMIHAIIPNFSKEVFKYYANPKDDYDYSEEAINEFLITKKGK